MKGLIVRVNSGDSTGLLPRECQDMDLSASGGSYFQRELQAGRAGPPRMHPPYYGLNAYVFLRFICGILNP